VDQPSIRRPAAEMLSHLLRLFPDPPPGHPEQRHRKGAEFRLSSHLLANLRQSDSTPKPHHLLALRSRFLLTTGAAFQVFGYDLDELRRLEYLLNRERTRFVECYPFDRDRPVDLPAALGAFSNFDGTTFLSDVVTSWQQALPTFPEDIPLADTEAQIRRLAEKVWKASSARLRSSMSRFIPIQYSNVPSLARRGSRRLRNQRYSPSEFRMRKAAWPAVPVLLQAAPTLSVSSWSSGCTSSIWVSQGTSISSPSRRGSFLARPR
jgi:hypothetical protein